MKRYLIASIAIAMAALEMQSPARAQTVSMAQQAVQPSPWEEIYVLRSMRVASGKETTFCAAAKTGFEANREDHYEFRATSVRANDGRMLDAFGKQVGSGKGCLGPTSDPTIRHFYLELQMGNTAVKGIGNCRTTRTDFPEAGLNPSHCQLNLTDKAGQYVGGQLTTNTMTSRALLGPNSDPAGYVQPSIATIRLWKNRP